MVFEGLEPATEGLNCAVCHGKEGIPMMTGALTSVMLKIWTPKKCLIGLDGVKMKDWPDALWYKRVTRGIDGTPMAPWGMIFQHLYLWKAEAYARTFHDPLDKPCGEKTCTSHPHQGGNRKVEDRQTFS